MCKGSDHYVVLAKKKKKIRDRWEYGKSRGKATGIQVIASEKLDRREV